MTATIIEYRELLRREPQTFLLGLEWPLDTNAFVYFNESPKEDVVTLFYDKNLVNQNMGWGFGNEFRGWHLWENASSELENLKFKHLQLKGPQVWFFSVKGEYHSPKELAKEIIFRLEVYLHYAE